MAIASLLALSACGSSGVRRGVVKPAARGGLPAVFCGRAALQGRSEPRRPAQIGCLTADGSEFLGGPAPAATQPGTLSWTDWTATQAIGHGFLWRNECQPSCSQGRYLAQPVSVRAVDPRDGWFRQLQITYTAGPPPGPATITYQLDMRLAQWIAPSSAPGLPSSRSV